MKKLHNIKEVSTIGLRIQGNKDADYSKVLADVQEIARLSGMIACFGWNCYYKQWNWWYLASKKPATYYRYLQSFCKVFPNGMIATNPKTPLRQAWIPGT